MMIMIIIVMLLVLGISIVNSYNIRVNSIRSITKLNSRIIDNDDDMIPPPPPGRGEWDDWDGTDAAIGGADTDNDNISFNGGGSSILSMLSDVNDDDDDINNYIITNIRDDKVKDKDIKKNKIVKTALKGKKKTKEPIIEVNFNDDDYDDDRIDINITKGAGAFSPSGRSDDIAFSNNEGRGPMDSWGASYSEESPYFDEDDIIEDWSDKKGTFISSMSSDLFAKPNIDDLIKSTTNNEDNKEVTTTSSVSASLSSSVSTSIDISLLTVTNEMNRRLNEIEMKSTIQYQDLKLFYCTVSALQLIIILLLMKM